MPAGDLHELQAALFFLPEHLGEVCHCVISYIPIPALLEGLLSNGEAGQLVLHPWPTHQQWERCLRLSRNHGSHCCDHLAHPDSLLLHLLVHEVGQPLASWRTSCPCEEWCELFWLTHHGPERVSWHSLASHSPLRRRYRRWKPLRWDFSDPPPPFRLLCLLINAYICILVKAWLW